MDEMTTKPYSGAGWIFRPGLQRGFREIALLPDSIVFGFCDLGDLAKLPPRRIYFRKAVTESYPDLPPSQFPIIISQFHWFAAVMQPGDLIALVDERSGVVYLGRVSGDYEYTPDLAPHFNRRGVYWSGVFPIAQASIECREHWRARTGLFTMGKILNAMSELEGDTLIRLNRT